MSISPLKVSIKLCPPMQVSSRRSGADPALIALSRMDHPSVPSSAPGSLTSCRSRYTDLVGKMLHLVQGEQMSDVLGAAREQGYDGSSLLLSMAEAK